jgi:hypothetical protein
MAHRCRFIAKFKAQVVPPRVYALDGMAYSLAPSSLWRTLLGIQHLADAAQGHIVAEDAEAGHRAATHAGHL